MEQFPKTNSKFKLDGLVGAMEMEVGYPDSAVDVVCIIGHPHPLYGGTMHNKVVTTLVKSLDSVKVATVRFNFRGVGQSAGVHDFGDGETRDVIFVIDWVRRVLPGVRILLAGFSFGSAMVLRAALERDVIAVFLVAPPVEKEYFPVLANLPCPVRVIQGDADEVISAAATFSWVDLCIGDIECVTLQNVGHFFHGNLLLLQDWLSRVVVEFVSIKN